MPDRSWRRVVGWPGAALLCLVAALFSLWICWARSVTTVVVVRHAEKAGGANPVLTPEGRQRAEALVDVVGGADVAAVYATNLCRTALTAEPLALELGVPIRIQTVTEAGGLGECGLTAPVLDLPASVDSADALADALLSSERGGLVVVVGHSNTVPALVEALTGVSLCPGTFSTIDDECRIPDGPPDDEYYHLFIVEVPRLIGRPRTVHASYGLS
ncbi:MAG: histidine phosphatase family protein [Thermoanaerobaculia bacterium]